jgi:hypothetical protein
MECDAIPTAGLWELRSFALLSFFLPLESFHKANWIRCVDGWMDGWMDALTRSGQMRSKSNPGLLVVSKKFYGYGSKLFPQVWNSCCRFLILIETSLRVMM